MVYCSGSSLVATRYGRGPSILASSSAWPPSISSSSRPTTRSRCRTRSICVTFAVMLVVALVISGLDDAHPGPGRRRRGQRERRIAALYAMSRELAGTRGVKDLLAVGDAQHQRAVRARVAILLPNASAELGCPTVGSRTCGNRWFPHRRRARWRWASGCTSTGRSRARAPTPCRAPPASTCPCSGSRGTVGRAGTPADAIRARSRRPEQLHQVETFASQTALAPSSARSSPTAAEQAQVRAETERLRNSLLSSVSHDLRTPLASITGAASTLLDNEARLDAATRRELLEALHEEADRLNRLVQQPARDDPARGGRARAPHRVALASRRWWARRSAASGSALAERPVTTRIPADLPLVPMDDVLIEQVLINLIDNAIKYTPRREPDRGERARTTGGAVVVEVADRGPGCARARSASSSRNSTGPTRAPSVRGAGLGLAICRGDHPGARRTHLGGESPRRRRRPPLHAAGEGRAAQPAEPPAPPPRWRLTRPLPRPARRPGRGADRGRAADPALPAGHPRQQRLSPVRGDLRRGRADRGRDAASRTWSSSTWACPTSTACR